MQKIQDRSLKIVKSRRKIGQNEANFVCGGCEAAYKSYPALYLHIKRKHNGIRPPNTKSIKVVSSLSANKPHTGRPQKPSLDVDGINEKQMQVEQTQSELVGFLGEKLDLITLMGPKPKFETLLVEIEKIQATEELIQLKKQAQDLVKELKQEENEIESCEMELDFETFYNLDKNNGLRILCWFLLWLGKYIVKFEALKDLTLVFSKIWTVMVQKRIEIQDLDNKLIWNGVMRECEPSLPTLNCFKNKKEFIYEFISKTCHLIGTIFE